MQISTNNILHYSFALLFLCVSFLIFKATQADNADRYATTLVDIYVIAANENPPRFLQKQYTVNVVENTPVGSIIATVSAMDNDEVSFPDSVLYHHLLGSPHSSKIYFLYVFATITVQI